MSKIELRWQLSTIKSFTDVLNQGLKLLVHMFLFSRKKHETSYINLIEFKFGKDLRLQMYSQALYTTYSPIITDYLHNLVF